MLFPLWPSHFILSGAISSSPPLFPSSILDTFWPRGLVFWYVLGDISFCPFIQLMRFSRQVYWSGLPFPPSIDYLLSELPAMTCPSWVALHRMSHSFIELHKPQWSVKGYVYIYPFFFVFPFHLDHHRALSRFLLLTYFMHSRVCMAIPISCSLNPLTLPHPLVTIQLFVLYICV